MFEQRTENQKPINFDEVEISLGTEVYQPANIDVEKALENRGFSNIEFLGKGWSSEAYGAEFDGKDCIIRVPALGGSGISTYLTEHAILEFIADKIKSVRIPKTYICRSDDLIYVVHEKIAGNQFDVNSFEKFETLSPIEQENFSRSVASFLAELHSIDISEFPDIKYISWGKLSSDCVRSSFERYHKFCESEGWGSDLIFSQQEIDKFCNIVDLVTNIDEPEVLLHRDFYAKNFVVDDEMRLIGVFDFGNSSVANRAIEFNTFVKQNDDGTFSEPLMLKKILNHYQQASGVLVTFNDIVNQVKLGHGYVFTWLVSSDEVINNNKDKLKDCVVKIKRWLDRE